MFLLVEGDVLDGASNGGVMSEDERPIAAMSLAELVAAQRDADQSAVTPETTAAGTDEAEDAAASGVKDIEGPSPQP